MMLETTGQPNPAIESTLKWIGTMLIALLMNILILSATIFLSGYFNIAGADGGKPREIQAVRARVQPIEKYQKVTGTLRASSRSEVAALEEGRILQILAEEGASVRKGQVLARIDARRLQAQLLEANAELARAKALWVQRKAEWRNAQRNLQRYAKLLQDGVIPSKQHKDSVTASQVAEAVAKSANRNLKRVQSRIQHLEIRLSDTVIKAPFDGRIVQKHAESGEWIRPGKSVVTLVSTGTIEAWLEVPERFAESVGRNPQKVQLRLQSTKKVLQPLNLEIVPQVNRRSRTFHLVVVLDGKSENLVPGMSVNGWIPTGKIEKRMLLPQTTLRHDRLGFYIYEAGKVKNGLRQVKKVRVQVLFETQKWVAVVAPSLSERSLVVISDKERIHHLAQYSVTEKQPNASPQLIAAALTRE